MTDSVSASRWFKSSRSGPNACVEVRFAEEKIQVRDAKNRSGPVLTFHRDEWAAFVEGVRLGEFNTPSPASSP